MDEDENERNDEEELEDLEENLIVLDGEVGAEYYLPDIGNEEELEDEDDEDDDDDDDDDVDDVREVPVGRVPNLQDVNRQGRPLWPREYPATPDNLQVPDDAINDPTSILRHSLQECAYNHRVMISHSQIENTVRFLKLFPGAENRKDEEGLRRFLFGWESLVWRKKLLPDDETRHFVKSMVVMSVEEVDKTMEDAREIDSHEETAAKIDKLVEEIMPILDTWVSRQ